MIILIDEACAAGARCACACEIVNLSPRTVQRWRKDGCVKADGRQEAGRIRSPANKLSESEQQHLLAVANSPEYSTLPPSQIVPALADQGIYLASESTFYRLLREANQLAHRGKAKPASRRRPTPLAATGPNQLWSWDITYLPTAVLGLYFYLYLILDVYSRKIVGWEVFEVESAEHAATVFRKAHLREGIAGEDLILHSDNGSPMKGATMLATLQQLGVIPSFSRPSVSNDNPYSESLFKTLKYCPRYPNRPFESLEAGRKWVHKFTDWYKNNHRHSALKFVNLNQRHQGQDKVILSARTKLYRQAKAARPERWSGSVRDWQPDTIVFLNPNRSSEKEVKGTQKAA